MRSYDIVGWTSPDGYALCTDHGSDDGELQPIFADSEWDYYPICDVCGSSIGDVNLTSDGREYEATLERIPFANDTDRQVHHALIDLYEDEYDSATPETVVESLNMSLPVVLDCITRLRESGIIEADAEPSGSYTGVLNNGYHPGQNAF